MSCVRTIKYILNCGTTVEGESYTFSNDNVTGVGVFSADTANAVTFKGIASSGNTITITNDAGNKTVNLEINPTGIPALVPQATETVQGKIELATAAEVITGTDTERAVTPAGLAGLTATTLRAGLVPLATNIDTSTGVSTTRAVTPAGLKSVTNVLRTQSTFADAAARSTTSPAFIGQIGVQQDTLAPYMGYNTTAGSWEQTFIYSGGTTSLGATTTLNADLANLVIQDITDGGGGLLMEQGGTLTIGATGNLNLLSSGRTQIDGADVATVRLLGTSATAGQMTSYAISSFINATSTTADYTINNALDLRTYDADTVTTAELADVVATLILDLNSLKLPTLI
jgi:hypothetical protein